MPRYISEFILRFRWQAIILLFGLSLIGAGVLAAKAQYFTDQEIEIINPTPVSQNSEIVVEIAGSVEKPGVYKLPNGSRIDDLLTVSGGLSANADRELIEKSLNRAAKLIDGQKLYLPAIDEQTKVLSANSGSSGFTTSTNLVTISEGISQNGQKTININTASQSELESLSGIGPVYAQKIIDNRPYSEITELVSKKIIPQKTYDKIRETLTIY